MEVTLKVTDQSLTPVQMAEAVRTIVAGPKDEFLQNVSNAVINVHSEWTPNTEVSTRGDTQVTNFFWGMN